MLGGQCERGSTRGEGASYTDRVVGHPKLGKLRGYLHGIEGLGRHKRREHASVGGLELHSRREHLAGEGGLGQHGRRGYL